MDSKQQIKAMEELLEDRTPDLMDATGHYSVLVPLVEREGELCLLYEVRAKKMRRQPGEVCFPGGRMEPGESPEQCALRETREELGIPPEQVRILGELDFIANRANYIMHSVLGVVEEQALGALTLNPDEVDEVFFVPLRHLLHTEPLTYDYGLIPDIGEDFPYELIGIPREYRFQAGRERGPIYPWEGHAVWGLTGRITQHLIRLIRGGK